MSAKNNNCIVQPYLFFNGRCEEALDFYGKVAVSCSGRMSEAMAFIR